MRGISPTPRYRPAPHQEPMALCPSYSPYIDGEYSGKLCAPSLALDWQIKRLIEVEARVSYHARRWYVHVASDFPLAHHYRAVLAWGPLAPSQ
jgi:hypothetical protein